MLAAAPQPVQAQGGPELALTWQADPACPQKGWALSALRDRLGRKLTEGEASSQLSVRADLRRSGSAFTLSLATQHGSERGERSLQAPRCEVLAQTAVLVIALALEDQAERPAIVPTSPATGPALPEPALASEAPRPTQPRTSPFALRVAAMIDGGFLPAIGVGPEATFAFNRGPFSAQLSGFFLPSRSSPSREDGRVAVSLWGVRPAGCAQLLRGAFSLDLCAGIELGRVSGEGSSDLMESRTRSWLYRGAWAAIQMMFVSDTGWEFLAMPGLSVPLGRPQFVSETSSIGTRTELHTPSPVSARLSLGVGRKF